MSDPGARSGSEGPAQGAPAPFVSTLSVPEFAFAREASLEPLTAVQGCNVRWISQPLPVPRTRGQWSGKAPKPQVLPVPGLDAEYDDARTKAFAELTDAAARVGADSVVGVRRLPGVIDWDEALRALSRRRLRGPGSRPLINRPLEYQVLGTAVRDPRGRSERPRLSTLSAGDTWKLRRRGWRPIGVVAGVSYHVCIAIQLWAGAVAREIEPATEVWTASRGAAFTRVGSAATALGAAGVVGVDMQVDHHRIDWHGGGAEMSGLLVGISVIGTAISREDSETEDLVPTTTILTV